MAGMKRFVTYIYAYEDKKKGRNVGFARIEIRGEDCRIEIHLRGVYAKQLTCNVYMFRENQGKMEGISIGDMQLINGNGDYAGKVKAGQIAGTPLLFKDMEGIILLDEDATIFMSRWKDGKPVEVCRENFSVWQRENQDMDTEEKMQIEEQNAKEKKAKEQKMEVEKIETEEQSEEKDFREQEQDMQATEIPMRNIFPEYDWESVWENLIRNHTLYHPFDNPEIECVQIELKHLRELPKTHWYLGNNSFLLHGFFNYHYLIVGKAPDERWFLGIPGVYQSQERVMAAIFGFPEFIAIAQNEEALNHFGFWCRYLEE